MNRQQLQNPFAVSLLLAGLLVSTMLAGQRGTAPAIQPAAKPIRIGFGAKQVTDQEVAELIKLLPAGESPWLIKGYDPGFSPSQTQRFDVYMPPASATPGVRHGVAIAVIRPIGSPSAWSIVKKPDGQPQTFDYAQVAIAGLPFDQIQDENDVNWPFALSLASNDADIVSLVTFVRNLCPSNPVTSVKMRLAVSPIPVLGNTEAKPGEDEEVSVRLRETSTAAILLSLRKVGQSWEVSRWGGVYQ